MKEKKERGEREREKEKGKTKKNFTQILFKFAEESSQSNSVTIKCTKEELEDHLRETYSDPK